MPKVTLKSIFLSCDIFGKKPEFAIKRKRAYQTHSGAIMSLLLVIAIIIFSWQFGIDLIFKRDPSLLTTIFNDELPQRINLSSSFFIALSLQFENYTPFINESIYEASAELITIVQDSPGKFSNTTEPIDLIRCSHSSIGVLPDYFNKLDLNNLYCFKNLSRLYLEGDYAKQYWTYISFAFKKCREKIGSSPKCQSEEEINSRLKSGYFGFFITDSRINALNYDNPRQLFGLNEFTTFSWDVYRDVWLKLKTIQVVTDSGFLLPTNHTLNYAGTDSFTYIWDNRKTDTFLSFMMRSSPNREVYKRSYLKIQTFAANLGGTAKFLVTIAEIIMYFISSVMFKDYINQFYSKSKPKQSSQTLNLNHNCSNKGSLFNNNPQCVQPLRGQLPTSETIKKDCFIKTSRLNKSSDILINSMTKELSKTPLRSPIPKSFKKIKKVNRNECYLLSLICCFLSKRPREEVIKLLRKYESISLSFDFIYFIKSMNDVRLIKHKVFNTEEMKLNSICYQFEALAPVDERIFDRIVGDNCKDAVIPDEMLKGYQDLYERFTNEDNGDTFHRKLLNGININHLNK